MPRSNRNDLRAVGYAGVCLGPCFCCTKIDSSRDIESADFYSVKMIDPIYGGWLMALPKRGSPVGTMPNQGKEWTDPLFKDEYPALHAFLYDVKYDDGSVRVPGSISLFCKLGCLTFAINDNDRKLVAFVNEYSWGEALIKIDNGIGNDSLDWKPQRNTMTDKKPPY